MRQSRRQLWKSEGRNLGEEENLRFRRNHGPNLFSRQENLLAKRLAGWGIGEECNPAVKDFSFFKILKS